jgi:septum formation protein
MSAVVLASASPRRLQLLASLGLEVTVCPADIDETPRSHEPATDYVRRLAAEKCAAVEAGAAAVVIAADTTVAVDGEILGKPVDAAEAVAMLQALSGREHQVHTGVTVRRGERQATTVATTVVRFVSLSDEVIAWYVATGEPFDKAGAYAIQGSGAVLVESVTGNVSNVVGLPLSVVVELAASIGIDLLG